MVGGESYELDELKLRRILTGTPGKTVPKINKIDIFGCNVGRKPSKLKSFGRIYNASKVSAFTW